MPCTPDGKGVTDIPLRPATGPGNAPHMASFEQQLILERADGERGRYVTELDDAWNCPIVPHGGVVTSLAARAMALELDRPEQPLRTITAVFAGQVKAGAVDIDVAVLRRGRSMSQATATVRNPGEDAGLTAVAVFGAARPGFRFTDLTRPDVPPPDACPSFRDVPPDVTPPFHFNFWDHVEGRLAAGHARWDAFPPGPSSERAYWYRFDEGGLDDPLALVVLADTMPGAVAERVGSDQPVWLPPSTDLTVHLFGEARSEWVLARNHARHAGDGYASLDMELWDPDGRLLAYGTQVAFFTFPEGPPASQ
jgi:acyl-CoA thioesterase